MMIPVKPPLVAPASVVGAAASPEGAYAITLRIGNSYIPPDVDRAFCKILPE